MNQMVARMICVGAVLSAALAHALLPLYENPQLYQQLADHNQRLLPGLNGQIIAQRQQLLHWLRAQLEPDAYQAFIQSRMFETLINTLENAVRTDMTNQYARRSLQLIQRYEQKIKELTMMIEQLQAQEPLRISSTASEVSTGLVLPEDVAAPRKKSVGMVPAEFEQEGTEQIGQAEPETQEEQEEAEEEKPVVTKQQLQGTSRPQAALTRVELTDLKKEIQEGLTAEQTGTATPGWRERIMQKWQQLKDFTGKLFSSGDVQEPTQ